MSVSLIGAGAAPFVAAVAVAVDDTLHLDAVRDARGDVNEIRLLLKGNVETCHRLFREAEKEGDVVTQIQLSHALLGMKWGKDDTKDFSSLLVGDLEKFSYYPREFALFNLAYDQAMGVESDWRTGKARGVETFRLAANRGYLPAFLELMHKEWKGNASSYGFAAQLRPFVGKGDRQLDYYFGQALKNGCQIGSEQYYEGLYWMNRSCDTLKEKLGDVRIASLESYTNLS